MGIERGAGAGSIRVRLLDARVIFDIPFAFFWSPSWIREISTSTNEALDRANQLVDVNYTWGPGQDNIGNNNQDRNNDYTRTENFF